jgi:hypothetical protein
MTRSFVFTECHCFGECLYRPVQNDFSSRSTSETINIKFYEIVGLAEDLCRCELGLELWRTCTEECLFVGCGTV